MQADVNCKICGDPTVLFDHGIVLQKYQCDYLRCTACGFIQVDHPFWLGEAYSEAISDEDTGLVARAFRCATLVRLFTKLVQAPNPATGIDCGGGYGILVRLLRDKGLDFRWSDAYCVNLFAKTFEDNRPRYDIATAFEVLEHLPDPLENFRNIVDRADNVLFTTTLVPTNVASLKDWWYFAPDAGQHISFFTLPALSILASKFGRTLTSNGVDTHCFTVKTISSMGFRIISKPKLARVLEPIWR